MDNSVSNPKGQHYLPEVYLKAFCDEAGKLHLYDFVKKEFRSNINPKTVVKKNHIYTITDNGNKDYCIEDFFGEHETKYGVLIETIKSGGIEELTEDDILDIIWFISCLYARNLSKVTRFSEMSLEGLYFRVEGLLNYNLWKQGEEYLRPNFQIKINKNYVQKEAMLAIIELAETMFNLLINEGNWFFCISQAGSEFITTDDPMDNMVMIPLSKKILFMRATEKMDGLNKRVLYVTPDWVSDINCKIASSAKQYVFASSLEKINKFTLINKAKKSPQAKAE